MMETYPLAMLNEKYARLAPPKTVQERISSPFQSFQTLQRGMIQKEANDASLARMEDSIKRGGGLAIATLATLGAANRMIGVGEYLGFLSWFFAMAITPKIVNSMVWFKTGINLNQEYIDTQGIRQPLFKDRKYLPLNLISDEKMHQIADRIGIPRGISDRRRLTEEKVGQISVQARTAWMLLAGPATPVISGLLCDLFQDKVAGLINGTKRFYYAYVSGFQTPSGKPLRSDEALKRLESYIAEKVGETSSSQLSRWWKGFGDKLVGKLGMKQGFAMKDAIRPLSQDELNAKIIEYLETLGRKPEHQYHLEHTQVYLQRQRNYLQRLQEELMVYLSKAEGAVGKAETEIVRGQVKARMQNALTTLSHYKRLLAIIKKAGSKEEIQTFLEKPILGEVQKLFDQGLITEAKRFIGNDSLFEEIRQLLHNGQYRKAFNRLGAAPGEHLQTSLKDVMLRKLWRQRIVFTLGGGMLAAMALYNHFLVGRNFGQSYISEPPAPETLAPTGRTHGW